MSANARLRPRRDTAANWTSTNPVLALGELGIETDTRRLKAGDGSTAWASLDYIVGVTLPNGNAATPAVDHITIENQRVAAGGYNGLMRVRSDDGIVMTMQPHLGRNTVFGEAPQGSSSTIQSWLCNALTVLGSVSASVPASTNRRTRAKVANYTSAATAGSNAGRYNAHAYVTVGAGGSPPVGGFRAVFRWGCGDAAAVATAHMFIGLSSATGAPSATTAPDTLTNQIGVAQVNGSANLKIVYGGSAAQTAIDLGASFPAADTSAEYELVLYASPTDGTKVSYLVTNISTGATTSGVLSGTAGTVLPANSTFLGPRMWRSNNATALAVTLSFISWMIEADI